MNKILVGPCNCRLCYLFIYYSLQSKSNKGQVKVTLQGNNVINLLKSFNW